jgi:hypothetical protein
VNDLGHSASGSEAERITIDNGAINAPVHGHPNAEHTVIDSSKRGKRDRTPRVLTIRQSVEAHLSLKKTELLKVSRPPDESKVRIPGPDLRHGRRSLLERISGMEGTLPSQPAPAAHPDISAIPDTSYPLPPAAVRPQQSVGTSSDNIPTEEGTVVIDNHHPDPISNTICKSTLTAHADRPDRVPRANTDAVLERTRIRLAKMKNAMVAGVPPTAPTPPPIPLDPSTPAELEEPPSPAVANLRDRLLERLEGERKRAIGAASGELEVEPVAGNISEDSLKAELKARNRLRTRLVVAKVDRHVGILEP